MSMSDLKKKRRGCEMKFEKKLYFIQVEENNFKVKLK